MNILNNSLIDKKSFNYLILLISILPLTLIIGSAVINITVILVNIFFLFIFFKYKISLKNQFSFYILIFFWLSLLINLYFSSNFENTYLRSFGFIRFVLLSIAIQFVLENCSKKQNDKIFLIWTVFFLIISIDLLFEFIFGFNLIGNKSSMPGRLSGFLGDELKIGNYYFGFSLLAISFIFYKSKKNYLVYLFLSLAIFISFIIGERSNFLKFFIIASIFLFIFEKKNFFIKSFFVSLLTFLIILFINFNSTYKERFWKMFGNELIQNKSIIKTINNSPYGGHWNAAWEIFKDNKIFGVGFKNFRTVSGDIKYFNKKILFSERRQNTHPHQLHLEFLAEGGLFGFIAFILLVISTIFIGIKIFIKNHNLYQLSSLLFFSVSTILFIPSGSFFTTYGASIFWILYGIAMAKNKRIDI